MCLKIQQTLIAIRKFNLSEMQKPDSFVLKYGSNIDVKNVKV